jgi:hypothetical protein
MRFIALLLPLAVCACARAPAPQDFVLADPKKYETPEKEALARQLTENDCKARALAADVTVHRTVASEDPKNQNLGVQMQADLKAKRMYSATFVACMNKAGFLYQPGKPSA